MTRIKYRKFKDIGLEAGPFLAGSIWLSVVLRPDNLTYHVYNGNKKLKEGTASSLTSLKKKVKLVLKELGTIFNDEIRNKYE